MLAPVKAQPFHRVHNRIHILRVFGHRIGVVETHVATAVVAQRQAEIQADRLGMPVMQVAIGLRRESGTDFCRIGRRPGMGGGRAGLAAPGARGIGAFREIGFDDIADEVGDLGGRMRRRLGAGGRLVHE